MLFVGYHVMVESTLIEWLVREGFVSFRSGPDAWMPRSRQWSVRSREAKDGWGLRFFDIKMVLECFRLTHV